MKNLVPGQRVIIKSSNESVTVITSTHGYVTVREDSGREKILYENEISTKTFLAE
jgi:hypothetical protein